MQNDTSDAYKNNKLAVLIVDQDKTLFEGEAKSLIMPGKGNLDIGILPFHTPLYTKIYKGNIQIHTEEGDKDFPIEGGMARVINNSVIILVGF